PPLPLDQLAGSAPAARQSKMPRAGQASPAPVLRWVHRKEAEMFRIALRSGLLVLVCALLAGGSKPQRAVPVSAHLSGTLDGQVVGGSLVIVAAGAGHAGALGEVRAAATWSPAVA